MMVRDNETYINKKEIIKKYHLSKNFASLLISLKRFEKFTIYEKNVRFVNERVFEQYLVENGLWGDISEYVQYIRNCV